MCYKSSFYVFNSNKSKKKKQKTQLMFGDINVLHMCAILHFVPLGSQSVGHRPHWGLLLGTQQGTAWIYKLTEKLEAKAVNGGRQS